MIIGGMFIVQLGLFQIGIYARKPRHEVLGCVDLKVGKEHRQNISGLYRLIKNLFYSKFVQFFGYNLIV